MVSYLIGSGPLSISLPPETLVNTWDIGCGKITAELESYDSSLARLYADEIVIETAEERYIGKTSELVFTCYLIWDEV